MFRRSLLCVPALVLGLLVTGCTDSPEAEARPEPQAQATEYAGIESCKECHKKQYDVFMASQHRKYVQVVSPQSVIGDFETNNVLEVGGAKTTMIRRGDDFFVETTGPDGKLHEYKAVHTIGFYFKQRYETVLEDGRRYVLPVQWNKNEKRWVDYHGLKKEKPGSGHYWSDPQRALAVTCAGCHGTGVKLFPAPTAERPKIVESDMTVSCEACHGACGPHVADPDNKALYPPISLKNLDPRRQVDVCGKCHTRGEDAEHGFGYPYDFKVGERLHLKYAFVEPTIGKDASRFWADGRSKGHHQQQIDFVTSAHYTKAGMTCISCHDPMAGGLLKLKDDQAPNDLCLSCHTDLVEAAALQKHSGHDPTKEGALCVGCHMPKIIKNEQPMQLHHHGASIPNPRKTLLWGTPNACSICHNDPAKNDSPQRMIDAMTQWNMPVPPVKTSARD